MSLFKAAVYLCGITGIGWVLMKVTEPTPEKLKKISESAGEVYGDELKRKHLIVQRLREAAEAGSGQKIDPTPPYKK